MTEDEAYIEELRKTGPGCYVMLDLLKKFAFDVIMFLQQFSYCIWYCDVYHLSLCKLQQKRIVTKELVLYSS